LNIRHPRSAREILMKLLFASGILFFFCACALTAQSITPATAPLDPATNPSNRPNTALIPVPQDPRTMDRQFAQKHQANVARAKQGNIDLLFLGDSIMQGWSSGGDWGQAVFDKYYAQYNTAVFAIGYDRTQHLLWRLANGEGEGYTPKVIELLIGTNNLGPNTPAETILGEKAVIDDLRRRFPDARILVLGIFPRGNAGDPIRKDIAAVNDALEKMADQKHIFYLDIGGIFLHKDLSPSSTLKADHLHPSAEGYRAWAEIVQPTLDELLKDTGVIPKAPATEATR
jgi:lysophospholipase L1-like esterase